MTAQHGMCGDVAVLVPAAGMGSRLGPGAPKALRLLDGQPLLVHATRRVVAAESVGCVVVAAPPDEVAEVRQLLAPVIAAHPRASVLVVAGAATRQASVAAALAVVPVEFDIVLVHDAARALTPSAVVDRVAGAVRRGADAVVPVLPVVDTVKAVDGDGRVTGTLDRAGLRSVQTPQGFRRDTLVAAHAAAANDHTDDAGLAESIGVAVHTVAGDQAALKITHPFDLTVAELLLR
ncbi:MAG: 2-C-methyl-D-erythritol 4-phosphate cytidylyltransferase [Dactylosporangium sp.]|nr:2-C-methyl-D-erythritol 4-phosphate cytidylyltransferase [Dactylosporangium sp.]NNJ62999.1 2-C-methyl-D-erythritol 4-phosphate cytidylyltransferase [Dactylosporangium sp.]